MARILLVDDDNDLLIMARAILNHAGHDVTTCDNAIEALERARTIEFDLVITDANMAPYSGYDLIRSLKQVPGFDLIPIAMLTGRREKRDVERAVAVGAQDYIVKPLDPERFVAKVSELVLKSENARRMARFAEVEAHDEALAEIPMMIVGISEAGCLLDCDHQLREGSRIRLNSTLFEKIGVPVPTMKVTSCAPGAVEGAFEARVSFHNLDDKSMQKIRQYIQANAMLRKKNSKSAA